MRWPAPSDTRETFHFSVILKTDFEDSIPISSGFIVVASFFVAVHAAQINSLLLSSITPTGNVLAASAHHPLTEQAISTVTISPDISILSPGIPCQTVSSGDMQMRTPESEPLSFKDFSRDSAKSIVRIPGEIRISASSRV